MSTAHALLDHAGLSCRDRGQQLSEGRLGRGFLGTGRTGEEAVVSVGIIYAAPQRERGRHRGSFTTVLSSSKIMAVRVSSRKAGQPGSPSVTKSTQARCILSASAWGGSSPKVTSTPDASRLSKAKGTSTQWAAPNTPPIAGERQADW